MSDFRTALPDEVGAKISTQRVKIPRVFMRRDPKADGACETEALFGTDFEVYKQTNDWVWGQLKEPFLSGDPCSTSIPHVSGYIGWLPKAALGEVGEAPTHIVTALQAPIFTKADIKSPVKQVLNLNATVCASPSDSAFVEIDGLGFMHTAHLATNLSSDTSRQTFVDIAERHMGLPYIWGGISTNGLDCSGLVKSSLRAVGRSAPRDADQQEASLGIVRAPDLKFLQRGDLVFWKGHVGIMQNRVHLIHANAFHMCVTSEPLIEAVERIRPQSGEITAIKSLKI